MRLISLLKFLRAMQLETVQRYRVMVRQQTWRERGVEVATSALIRLGPGAILEIGAGTTVGPFSILDLLSDPLALSPSPSKILIGERVGINEFTNLRAGGGEIRIGDGCLIAQYVSIIATNHAIAPGAFIRDQPWDMRRRHVVVGDDVWIGTHAVVLPGVSIGSGSVVAAGAVVASSVPENVIVGGVPARVIGRRR